MDPHKCKYRHLHFPQLHSVNVPVNVLVDLDVYVLVDPHPCALRIFRYPDVGHRWEVVLQAELKHTVSASSRRKET